MEEGLLEKIRELYQFSQGSALRFSRVNTSLSDSLINNLLDYLRVALQNPLIRRSKNRKKIINISLKDVLSGMLYRNYILSILFN